MSYKLSNYAYFCQSEKSDRHYLFNTLQRSYVEVSESLRTKLENNPCELSDRQIATLRKMGNIIEEEINEYYLFRQYYDTVRYSNRNLGLTFLPTARCNCSCLYCYEEGYRESSEPISTDISSKGDFALENTSELCNWILKLCSQCKPEALDFCFHGGEPLLRPDVISHVSSTLRAKCEEAKIQFDASIVTNGTLLTADILDQLHNNGIQRLLLTLDGPEEVHDIRRPYTTGLGSFKEISANMRAAIVRGFVVYLGVNVDRQNAYSLEPLIHQLASEYKDYSNLILVYGIVKEGPECNSHVMEYGTKSMREDALTLMNLYELTAKAGLRTVDPIGGGYCSYRKSNSFIIDSCMDLYKCVTMVGHRTAYVGSVKDPLEYTLRKCSNCLYDWNSFESNESCQACSFLPLCLGGCVQQAVKNQMKRDCQKGFFSNLLPRAIPYNVSNKIVGES